MSWLHEVALATCLVAGVVAVALAPNRATRVAHTVMLAAMVVMALAMDSTVLVLFAGAVLLAAAFVLRRVSSKAADRLCALDLSVCGGLLLLSAVAVTRHADTASPMQGMHRMTGMTGAASASMVSAPLLAATGAMLLAWLLLQRRVGHGRGRRALPGAAMVLAMGAMVVS